MSSSDRPERPVFKYFNGVAEVFGDAMAIRRRLNQLLDGDPGKIIDQINTEWVMLIDPETHEPCVVLVDDTDDNGKPILDPTTGKVMQHPEPETIYKPNPMSTAARERLHNAILQAFPMQPFDPATGKGALEDDFLEAWRTYQNFWSRPRKMPDSSPTTPAPTEAPVCPPSSPTTTASA